MPVDHPRLLVSDSRTAWLHHWEWCRLNDRTAAWLGPVGVSDANRRGELCRTANLWIDWGHRGLVLLPEHESELVAFICAFSAKYLLYRPVAPALQLSKLVIPRVRYAAALDTVPVMLDWIDERLEPEVHTDGGSEDRLGLFVTGEGSSPTGADIAT